MSDTTDQLIRALQDGGLVRRLVPGIQLTDEPKLSDWHCVARADGPTPRTATGGGYGVDDGDARIKAVGEAVERLWCDIVPPESLRRGRYCDVDGAVDPGRFVNFGPGVTGGDRGAYVAQVRNASLGWVAGTRTGTMEPVWLPAQVVYTGYDPSREPLLRAPISTGAAFEARPEIAVRRGLFEIVERDAVMLWWLSGRCPPKLRPSTPRMVELVRYFERYLLEVDLLDITTDVGVPSVMAVLRDRTGVGPAVACGLKAAASFGEATLGAVIEAYQARKYARCLYLEREEAPPRAPEEVIGIESRALFWYLEEMLERIEPFLAGDEARHAERSAPVDVEERLARMGLDAYQVDLGGEGLRRHGCYVFKAVVPEMHPLFLREDLRQDVSDRLAAFYDGPPNPLPHPCI